MVLLSSSSLLVRVHSIKAVAYNNRTINLQRNILNRNQTFFLSTKVPATSNLSDPESRLTLYQYQICPFCNKTKALLNYASIDYDEVEVNPLTKAELKPWSGSYRKVPIAILDGEQHNGSDEIQSALLNDNEISSYLQKKWQSSSKDGTNKEDSSDLMTMEKFRNDPSMVEWNEFSEKLARILYPNICRSLSDSYNAFSYVKDVKEFSFLQKISVQAVGSVAMYFAASKIKKKLNIEDERKALNEALDELEKKGLEMGEKSFISGSNEPNMADITIFGTLRSIEHLASFKEVMHIRDSKIAQIWYDQMRSTLGLSESSI